ncbi:succinate dehydrogenase/fumarate reductase iron-sulfur subunit [Bdellovibrio sp. GT3]|uniref:succinate dehydrogenase/fumarate reductase iron-sulfur subunit n=1 Tax=Bdellovibrio sp. GT3 TaxID=3136282 RepID=UPI0030F34372
MSGKNINLTLKVWRQKGPKDSGSFVEYPAKNVSEHASFLEMLDAVNEEIVAKGEEPIAFDHDCREGICGTCGFVIDGEAHGKLKATTVCQLHMRNYEDGDTLTIEPFRANSFPVIKDLMVDRSAFDRIISSGGYISQNTGNPQDANAILIPKADSDEAMSSATCIGCGACVAACKNASAALFTSAKISHMALLPQGAVEKDERALRMVAAMDSEGFGACTTTGACEAACPKEIQLTNISRMNRQYLGAVLTQRPKHKDGGAG